MAIATIRTFIITLGVLVLFIAGCTYFGKPTGQDRVEADTLEQEVASYQEWQTPDWVEGFNESAHPAAAYVKYYINPAGMADLDNPSVGTILVKEQYNKNKQMTSLTVMKKIDGYDPENNDWYWAITDADRRVTSAGKLSSCISCHKKGDGGSDLLFVND